MMMVNKTRNNSTEKMSSCKLQAWIPPNDRELIIRAKLKTGWSSRSSFTQSQQSMSAPIISDNEYNEIENVIKRASQAEKKELARISRLIERYKSLNKPLGDGVNNCLICNCNFGRVTSSPARVCNHCLKNVCSTCSFESVCLTKPGPIWLCKICAEYRDFLKKSGMWFSKKLPSISSPISPVMSSDNISQAVHSPSNNSINSKKSSNDSKLTSSPSTMSSIDDNKNSVMNADSKYTNLDSDCEQSKYMSAKSLNEEPKPEIEVESKQMLEQLTASKNLINAYNNTINEIHTAINTAQTIEPSYNKIDTENLDYLLPNKCLFKTSTLTSESTQNISLAFKHINFDAEPNLGFLQFNVEYIQSILQLKIHLVSASNLPSRDSNGLSDPYVKLHLLPGIAKATKLRSKTIYKNLNPSFNEEFHYDGVTLEDLDMKTLRLTVLDEDKFGFDFIGEYRLPLKTLIRNEINFFNVPLEEKQELGDESDLTSRGKINFAVKYSKKSNSLFVRINRCTQLLPMDNGVSSDPFVEVALLPGSKESKHKFRTSTKRKTLDPEFHEEFTFTNIDMRSLLTKTIEITVWDKDFGSKNDFIGVVKLGQQRNGDELKHFFTLIKNPELYHEKWHTLHMKDDQRSNSTSE